MKTSAKKLSLLAALAAGALALTSCAGSAVGGGSPAPVDSDNGADSPAVEEVVIGALHPLSGANAVDGQQMSAAAQLAVDDINAAGGIKSLGGAKLKLAAADTKGEADTGQSEAARLIQEGVVGLIGSYQSGTSAQIAAVSERNGVPFVMDVSALDGILEQGYTYSFRIQPSASLIGARAASALAEVMNETGVKVTNVGYLYEQGNYGSAAFEGFKEEAAKHGIEVSASIAYDPASSDLTTQVQQALAGGAELLLATGYYNDSLLVARATDAIAPDLVGVLGIGNAAFDSPNFVNDGPGGGENYLDTNYRLNVMDDRAKAVAEAFEESYGEPMRAAAALSYDAVMVIAQALEDAGSVDPAAVRDAIAASKYVPIVVNNGPVAFDEKGQNQNADVAVTQIQQGKVLAVFPDTIAEAEIIFPAPVK